jgi:hypothetical protein
MRLSDLYQDRGLTFATRMGTPVNPEHLVKQPFKPLLKKTCLPEIRFHDLRTPALPCFLAEASTPSSYKSSSDTRP